MTADPIDSSDEPHRFVYVNNRPINLADPLGLYSTDVHRDMTKQNALMTRYSDCAASEVAAADQGVDDNPETKPTRNREARRLWHFPTQRRVNELLNEAYSSCSLIQLGRALHVLQDSYSHAGYGPKLGHWTSGPDDINTDKPKTGRMIQHTINVLTEFYKRCQRVAKKCCSQN